ncbi:hypothetical protein ACFX2C_046213 [Malus domestica]
MVEAAKVLYIVVVDEDDKREKGNESFRYMRPILQSSLQLVGCKPRHAFKNPMAGSPYASQTWQVQQRHGRWVLQMGLSLYVEVFISEGCHRLLDMVNAIEGSTKCDLDESRFRAVAILDLVFLVHVMFVLLIVIVTYAVVAKSVGIRRLGSYEALPNAAPSSDHNHIQMKALSGTQA